MRRDGLNQRSRRVNPANPFHVRLKGVYLEAPASRVAVTKQVLGFLLALLFAVSSYYVVSRYLITAVVIQGRSMSPTLQDGDRYFLNRLALWLREPRHSDLVVIRDVGHHDFAVKRIIGLPHDTLEIRGGKVFINGERLPEPYLFPDMPTVTSDNGTLMTVLGDGQYFVLGDNRVNSEDSRSYGPLNRSQIIGLLVK